MLDVVDEDRVDFVGLICSRLTPSQDLIDPIKSGGVGRI